MSTSALMTTTMMMTMTIMASGAEVEEVRAYSGESVLLNSGLPTEQHYEVRWTHLRLLVSSGHTSGCDGQRCELLADGSLRLNRITGDYSGNYKLELFNSSSGKLMHTKTFLLRVDESSRTAGHPAAVCSLLLLLPLFITLFILWRKRRMNKRHPISDQMDVYVVMHQSKISQEEDGRDVSCHPTVSTETDIYM